MVRSGGLLRAPDAPTLSSDRQLKEAGRYTLVCCRRGAVLGDKTMPAAKESSLTLVSLCRGSVCHKARPQPKAIGLALL